MKMFKPPYLPQFSQDDVTVFLAGSIEQNKADRWQDKVAEICKTEDIIFFNPRRDNWDASLKQDISEPEFNRQVNWELNLLERSKLIFMYFDPQTQSPITLLEFGHYFLSGKLIVCCPPGFWRRGNLQICCDRAHIQLYDSLDQAISILKAKARLLST